MAMGENGPIKSRIGKAFVLENTLRKENKLTGVIGLIFQQGLLDNLKKPFLSRTQEIEKNGTRRTQVQITYKRKFLSGTQEIEIDGTRRKQVQITHKRKPFCEGGGVGVGAGGGGG